MVQMGSRNPAASQAVWEMHGAHNRSFQSLRWISVAICWQPNCSVSCRGTECPTRGHPTLQALAFSFLCGVLGLSRAQ